MEGLICRNNPYTIDAYWEGHTQHCNGWHNLVPSRCMRKCMENANAPSCPSSPSGKCVAFYYQPKDGRCHLFDTCDSTRPAQGTTWKIKHDTSDITGPGATPPSSLARPLPGTKRRDASLDGSQTDSADEWMR